jgi:TPP-dependent pyruvate/acetoin dehydrogenase alpha subunit
VLTYGDCPALHGAQAHSAMNIAAIWYPPFNQ